ncbi:UTP--glucose-1-phosphate uridylyltransferase isoform X1 [Ziziphus jujuba]|uniref:UTP--glucose-1-phosphate uridylyltransferase n=1 Tax=Ziziphus jujuba TaxID=326968 RepID=A0A6P4BEY8_ZIZJJ|nr:UTP--glucose-1-phosphate uridylyltransferase isoform X1 [Ziziphus jujuba]
MSPLHSIVIQKLLSTNAHLGRRVVAHHFKVFTYGSRNSMAVIDSDKTLICLRNAAQFISALAQQRARFMFVNTNSLFDEILEQMAKKIGCYTPSMNTLWRTGGFLTNSCSPKKFRSRNKKVCFGPTQPPDCLVVFDTERKSSVILEADRLQIPIVSLVDSAMPLEYYKRITYPVPANDSVQFVYLFCNLITKTFLLHQKRTASSATALVAKEDADDARSEKEEGRKKASQTHYKDDGTLFVLPYENLPPFTPNVAETKELLDKLVVVKFNATLGTDMGFDGPKCMIEFQKGLTFLDLFVKQIESLNSKYACNLPLLLMNTTRTHEDIEKVLEKYSSRIDIHAFEQNQHKELNSDGGQSGKDELYTSDHGAVLSLMNSGALDFLLAQGKEYILVVSSDNVAAIVDPKILNHLIQNKIEYCMEVTSASSYNSSIKKDNSCQQKFELKEIVQNSVKDSMEKFKLVNTGSLWMNLRAIKKLVDANVLKINISVSTGRDGDDTYAKTAAGSAVKFFDHAIGLKVPQSRFLPINSTSELLLFQSTLYTDNEGFLVQNNPKANTRSPLVELGPDFEKVRDFQTRFKSPPNIMELDSLKVSGDVWFGTGVTLKGKVTITAKPGMRLEIPDGIVLENKEVCNPADIL